LNLEIDAKQAESHPSQQSDHIWPLEWREYDRIVKKKTNETGSWTLVDRENSSGLSKCVIQRQECYCQI
jgi:hypothetical protein